MKSQYIFIFIILMNSFALAAETDALVMREFEGQLLDLQLAPFEFGVALLLDGLEHRQRGVNRTDITIG